MFINIYSLVNSMNLELKRRLMHNCSYAGFMYLMFLGLIFLSNIYEIASQMGELFKLHIIIGTVTLLAIYGGPVSAVLDYWKNKVKLEEEAEKLR